MACCGAHCRVALRGLSSGHVDSRVFTFASYLAALDTEEAAAAQMSRLLPRATECGTTG
jgi:hypothetical protein